MNIFLDDVRRPRDVTWVKLPELPSGQGWKIVRSHQEFCEFIDFCVKHNTPPWRVCFDHDLSEEHYPGREDYSAGNTGYDSAKYLAQVIIDNNWDIPQYVVHSLNPAAKGRIDAAMNDVRIYRERF